MLWGLYFGMTLLLTVLLWAGPMTLFDSICHAFGTISTGGFSSRAGSIAEFGSDYVLIVICIFMLLSGMNFAMLFKAATGRWRLMKHDEVTYWFSQRCLPSAALPRAISMIGVTAQFCRFSRWSRVLPPQVILPPVSRYGSLLYLRLLLL